MAIRKVDQATIDRVTAELAAAEVALVAAVETHDRARSIVAC